MEHVTDQPNKAERYWAQVRLAVLPLLCIWALWVAFNPSAGVLGRYGLLSGVTLWGVASLVLLWDQARRPELRFWRLFFALFTDYTGLSLVLLAGSEVMLPLSGFVLWVTVLYSACYDRVFGGLAWIFAVLSLAVVWHFSPHWQAHPIFLSTLLGLNLVVALALFRLFKKQRMQRAELKAKAQLWAQVSHDVRQPLQAIGLYNACLADSDLAPEQQRWVEHIDQSLVSVTTLFRSVLELYALEHAQAAPRQQLVALKPLLQHLISQNQHVAQNAGVDLRLRCPEVQVLTDPALLMTVMQNLLINALKYAPGRPVLLAARFRNQQLDLYCFDQGPGMAPEHLAQVSDEFYRAPVTHAKPISGVGLGLFIVRRISQILGWQVRIRSQLARGTSIRISALVVAGSVSNRTDTASVIATPQLLKDLSVCLFEPDVDLRQSRMKLLRSWGCSVEGYGQWSQQSFEADLLIVSASVCRERSASEWVSAVQALREHLAREVPVLLLSEGHSGKWAQTLAQSGIQVMEKNIQPAELRSVLLSIKQAIAVPL